MKLTLKQLTAAATLLLAVGTAQAGTVSFTWAYGKGNTVNVSTPAFHGQAGAFSATLSGFAAPFNGTFEAYCVELTEFINLNTSYTSYTIVTAESYFTAKPGVAAKLTNLISHINNTNLLANTAASWKDDQSTAVQLAIWNTIYDTDNTLSAHASATFSDTSAFSTTSFSNPGYHGANSLLASVAPASGYSLFVLQSIGQPGQQDQLIWLRNEIPEPGSLALVALALGGAGLASRRRG